MRALVIAPSLPAENWLSAANFAVQTASTAEEAVGFVHHTEFDIIVCELEAGSFDGIDLLVRLRSSRIDVPVVAISEAGNAMVRVQALRLGADDCIPMPLDRTEMIARVNAIIRRSSRVAEATLHAGSLSLNLASHQALVNGKPVHLTTKEYKILELLLLRKNLVVSKEGFLTHLYGGMDEPMQKIVDVFICKLRRKLTLAGCEDMIRTVWGRGHMLRVNAEVASGAGSGRDPRAQSGGMARREPVSSPLAA